MASSGRYAVLRGCWLLIAVLCILPMAQSLAQVTVPSPPFDDSCAIFLVVSEHIAEWAPASEVVVIAETEASPTSIFRTDPALSKSSPEYVLYLERVGGDLDDIPDSIRKAASAPPVLAKRNLVADDFGGKFRLVSGKDVARLFRTKNLEGAWSNFRKRFAPAEYTATISWPLVSADGADALVQLNAGCGPMCGSTAWLQLRKDKQLGQWVFVRKYLLAVS